MEEKYPDEFQSQSRFWIMVIGLMAFIIVGVFFLTAFLAFQEKNLKESGPSRQPVAALKKATFTYPYPITWREDNVEFSLTEVALGTISAPVNLLKSPGLSTYPLGEQIHALTLTLKIRSYGNAPIGYGVPLNLRRVVGEENDFIPPNTKQFYFPGVNGSLIEANTTHDNQKVIFVVPEDETEFRITTAGKSNLFFKIKTRGTGETLIVEKIANPFPALPPFKPLQVNWIAPTAESLTVERGEMIAVAWNASGGEANSRVSFDLRAHPYGFPSQVAFFSASANSGSFVITVPPGTYILKLSSHTSPQSREVRVVVTGPPSKISYGDSYIEFDDFLDDDGRIIADGVCSSVISAYIIDEYEYAITNKKVALTSSRGNVDSILTLSSATDADGYMGFVVTSKTPGIARLSASVDGEELLNALILKILDPKGNQCPNEDV